MVTPMTYLPELIARLRSAAAGIALALVIVRSNRTGGADAVQRSSSHRP